MGERGSLSLEGQKLGEGGSLSLEGDQRFREGPDPLGAKVGGLTGQRLGQGLEPTFSGRGKDWGRG